jgi:cell division septation protein DedD
MVRRVLLTAALLLALSASAAAQSVKAGIEAWQRSDYSAAVAIWRPLAEKGDADAAFNLGQAYRLGRGVPTNLAIAKSWFERAARQNHVDAQTTLGLLLFQNAEQAEGLKWLKAAAEQGEARALLVYGTALFNGDGVTQDQVLGYAYVSRAAAQGLAPAKETLAQLDSLMPLDLRKKGVAIAKAKAKAAPPPPSAKRVRTAKPAEVAAANPSPTPSPTPVKTATKPKAPTTATNPTAITSGAWRIQVGAFNNRAAAESAYGKLAGNAALAGRSPQYIPFNQFVRLRIGPFASKQSAAAACSALRTACYPVPPGK